MQIIKRSKKSIKKEIICWIALIMFLVGFNHTQGSRLAYYTYVVLYSLNFIWSFYVLYLIVFPSFFGKKWLHFVLGCILVIAVFITIDYIHVKKITPALGGTNFRGSLDTFHYIKRALIPFSFVAIAATTSYLNWRSIDRLKGKSEKENKLILRELSYYKAQFNSHFTLNFFNFCYNKTLYANSEAAEDVERFNEMLHFSLKNDSNEYVTLEDEVQYINNFICIQKCITSKVFIDIIHDYNIKDFYILPGILSTLVENSFKHGVFNEESDPIKLSLFIKNNILTIRLKNKKTNRKVLNSTGIGVNDLVEILKVFYPNKHQFKTNETDREYTSEITIELMPVG
jgi:two-component system LytT family sensor kinase